LTTPTASLPSVLHLEKDPVASAVRNGKYDYKNELYQFFVSVIFFRFSRWDNSNASPSQVDGKSSPFTAIVSNGSPTRLVDFSPAIPNVQTGSSSSTT
jgi:hypothetical protein